MEKAETLGTLINQAKSLKTRADEAKKTAESSAEAAAKAPTDADKKRQANADKEVAEDLEKSALARANEALKKTAEVEEEIKTALADKLKIEALTEKVIRAVSLWEGSGNL